MTAIKLKFVVFNRTIAMLKASTFSSVDLGNWMSDIDQNGRQERMMLLAMLDRAIRDLIERYCDWEDTVDAAEWLLGMEEDSTGFTLIQVCDYLDLDHERLMKIVEPIAAKVMQN